MLEFDEVEDGNTFLMWRLAEQVVDADDDLYGHFAHVDHEYDESDNSTDVAQE